MKVMTFQRASGGLKASKRAKTPRFGFTTSKTQARKAAQYRSKRTGTKYGTQRGYLIKPK